MGTVNVNKENLAFFKELLEAGKVIPVIDRRYPLSETAEAIRYLEEGHARGKLSSLCEDAAQMEKLWTKANGLHYKLLKALYFVADSSAKDSPNSRCYNNELGGRDW